MKRRYQFLARFSTGFMAAALALLALPAMSWATSVKTVGSGQSALIHEHSFYGIIPAGLRPPRPFIKQPRHGSIIVRTSVSGSGQSRRTLYKFFYISRPGYKGRDDTELGVSMQMRDIKGGVHDIILPEAERVMLVVR